MITKCNALYAFSMNFIIFTHKIKVHSKACIDVHYVDSYLLYIETIVYRNSFSSF
jgi:hypothetical protein